MSVENPCGWCGGEADEHDLRGAVPGEPCEFYDWRRQVSVEVAHTLAKWTVNMPAQYRNRHPRPVEVPGSDCDTRAWQFPRGMKDAEIRREIERQGFNAYGWDCHSDERDICGRTFSSGVSVYQRRKKKYAVIDAARCC